MFWLHFKANLKNFANQSGKKWKNSFFFFLIYQPYVENNECI